MPNKETVNRVLKDLTFAMGIYTAAWIPVIIYIVGSLVKKGN